MADSTVPYTEFIATPTNERKMKSGFVYIVFGAVFLLLLATITVFVVLFKDDAPTQKSRFSLVHTETTGDLVVTTTYFIDLNKERTVIEVIDRANSQSNKQMVLHNDKFYITGDVCQHTSNETRSQYVSASQLKIDFARHERVEDHSHGDCLLYETKKDEEYVCLNDYGFVELFCKKDHNEEECLTFTNHSDVGTHSTLDADFEVVCTDVQYPHFRVNNNFVLDAYQQYIYINIPNRIIWGDDALLINHDLYEIQDDQCGLALRKDKKREIQGYSNFFTIGPNHFKQAETRIVDDVECQVFTLSFDDTDWEIAFGDGFVRQVCFWIPYVPKWKCEPSNPISISAQDPHLTLPDWCSFSEKVPIPHPYFFATVNTVGYYFNLEDGIYVRDGYLTYIVSSISLIEPDFYTASNDSCCQLGFNDHNAWDLTIRLDMIKSSLHLIHSKDSTDFCFGDFFDLGTRICVNEEGFITRKLAQKFGNHTWVVHTFADHELVEKDNPLFTIPSSCDTPQDCPLNLRHRVSFTESGTGTKYWFDYDNKIYRAQGDGQDYLVHVEDQKKFTINNNGTCTEENFDGGQKELNFFFQVIWDDIYLERMVNGCPEYNVGDRHYVVCGMPNSQYSVVYSVCDINGTIHLENHKIIDSEDENLILSELCSNF
ncbi:hypothetical protein P9112_003583 [Eukaryota sp. TZLM1-RC]